MSKSKRGPKLEETESIGKALQERKKSEPSETDYRRMYDQVQAGHLTQRQAAIELKTSKGDIYRKFKELEKSESDSGANKQPPKAKSPRLRAKRAPQPQEQPARAESPAFESIEVGIQYVAPENLDNTRYQPRALIKAPADLILDMKIRGGNIYPVLVQASTGAVADGHRRVDAIARINAEQKKKLLVKCDVQDLDDKQTALLAYQANVLSSPLSDGERDKWIVELMDRFGYTAKEISNLTGLNEGSVSNIHRALTETTDTVKELLRSGKITTGTARAIVTRPAAEQNRIAKKVVQHKLSQHDAEEQVSELAGREETRKKLHATLYARENPKLVGTIEVDDRAKWRQKVIKESFGAEWHREGSHLVTESDVAAAEKMLGITVIEKKVAVALCESCTFQYAKKCFQGHKMPRHVCESYLRETMSWGGRPNCPICGGWTIRELALKGEKVPMHMSTHDACSQAALVTQGALSGVCVECSHYCSTARSVTKERYDNQDGLGKVIKRVNVTECSEAEPKVDIAALNARAQARVEAAITKAHKDDKTIAENHQIEHAREVVERADLEKQVAKATAPEPEPAKEAAQAGTMKPKSPAQFRETSEPKAEADA